MENIFFGTVLISPFLLLATYILTAKTKSFKKIFLVHTFVLVVYMTIILNYSKTLTGHDEYGLGQFALVITCIVIHIIIGFLHGLYLHYKIKKTI
jgi:hypothetical protein